MSILRGTTDLFLPYNIHKVVPLFIYQNKMAQLSQIMANDKRFGKPITNDDWTNRNVIKYIIERTRNRITTDVWWGKHYFLAFRTAEQRNLFLKENRDLIKQYFMID